MGKTNKSKLPLIIFISLVIIIIGINLFFSFINKVKFNDGIIYGNTAGNYYNKGLFCEYNGTVYFSNPHDKYTLYSMTPQGTDAKKIGEDNVGSINVDEHYIYYVRNNGSYKEAFQFLNVNTNSLCRINKNGKNHKILDPDPSLFAMLSGNYIYYIHYSNEDASTLYKVKIDGTEKNKLHSDPLLLSPAENGNFCFNGISTERNIHIFDTSVDSSVLLFEENAYRPIYTQSYVYFMDCENDFKLARIHKETGEKTLLTEERVECYNIYGNYIYYQTNSEDNPGIYRQSLESYSDKELIMDGIFTDINITSHYVYFRSFKNMDQFYQTPTTGPINVTPFEL